MQEHAHFIRQIVTFWQSYISRALLSLWLTDLVNIFKTDLSSTSLKNVGKGIYALKHITLDRIWKKHKMYKMVKNT